MAVIFLKSISEAVIDLQQTVITVTEGQDESVSVCVVVAEPNTTCPIDFSFEFTLRIGKSCDILHLSIILHILLFNTGEYNVGFSVKVRKRCMSVPLENDAAVEQTEIIPMELIRPENLNPRILLGASGMIVVHDDPSDGMFVPLMLNVIIDSEFMISLCSLQWL